MKNDLWKETIDEDGKSSLQVHEVKTVSVGCKQGEHYFIFEGGSKREARCKNCPTVSSFVLGFHKIVDGKIVKM